MNDLLLTNEFLYIQKFYIFTTVHNLCNIKYPPVSDDKSLKWIKRPVKEKVDKTGSLTFRALPLWHTSGSRNENSTILSLFLYGGSLTPMGNTKKHTSLSVPI